MSTNSNIALEVRPGIVKSIYCHWDGYLSHNGKILLTYWNDRDKLMTMIDEGDASKIAENLGTQHHFDFCPKDECNFYKRDRKDYKPHYNADEFELKDFEDHALEYFYYLDLDNNWHVSKFSGPFQLLTMEICNED